MHASAVEEDVWQDIPLGLDPRVLDLLGNSIALNTTASVRQEDGETSYCSSALLYTLQGEMVILHASCSTLVSCEGKH